jgi:hypothetical protein
MKSLLARDILGERAAEERKVTLNRPGRNLSARWNARLRAAIEASDVDLVGTLDDLPVARAGKAVAAELDSPTDEELLLAAAWARRGLDEAIIDLQQRVANLREEHGYGDGPVGTGPDDGDGGADADVGDDAGGDPEDDGPDDDPEDAGLDRRALLERQLKGRTPEVGLALTAIAEQVRRAMPLGAEVAALRARAASAPADPAG